MTATVGDRVKLRYPCVWPDRAGLEGEVVQPAEKLKQTQVLVKLDVDPRDEGLCVLDVRHVEVITRFEMVGPGEIATRLKVKRNTVIQWKQRSLLPEPDFTVEGGGWAKRIPLWDWRTIRAWALETGRLKP